MEITRDELLRVVKATRMAMRLAEATQKLFVDKGSWSIADEIAGQLKEALFRMSNDRNNGDFNDTMTMRLLTGDLNDEAVADWFLLMHRLDERRHRIEQEEAKQPKPQTMTSDEVRKMYDRCGGYISPEGEWK